MRFPERQSGSQQLITAECFTGLSFSGRKACSDEFQSTCPCTYVLFLCVNTGLQLICLQPELRSCRLTVKVWALRSLLMWLLFRIWFLINIRQIIPSCGICSLSSSQSIQPVWLPFGATATLIIHLDEIECCGHVATVKWFWHHWISCITLKSLIKAAGSVPHTSV